MRGDDRAVSEVIAFVLVFAIIIGSVGVLYMAGFQSMESFQQSEQLRNSERAMEALGQNIDDVQRNSGIQERQSELALRGGSLTVTGDGTELDITVDGTTETVTLGSITYHDGSSQIAYEGGAIFRGVEGDPSQSVVIAQPQFSCTDSTAMISLLEIHDGVAERTVAGDDVGEVTVIHRNTTVETYSASGPSSGVEIVPRNSQYQAAWDRLLDQTWDGNECEYTDVAIVRIVTVDVEL